MKKVAIVTITDNNNYGNRLQNYAVEYVLKKNGIRAFSIWKSDSFKRKIKNILCNVLFTFKFSKRYNNFRNFTATKTDVYRVKDYSLLTTDLFDYYLIGSDQIWNLKWQLDKNIFVPYVSKNKIISFAASFGVNNIDEKQAKDYIKILNNVGNLSVREDRGKEIIKKLTGRNDVEVLVDPTMLLAADEWDRVSEKPTMLKNDRYILNYFLGNLSDERRKEINRVAKENNCEVINILDKESPFYECGPSEFLYLEKNAFLICTDSFHSSVFGILYNTPFLVFEREDDNVSMNSRLDTLLSKFKLEDRRFKGKITKKDLKSDYTEAYKILEKERVKSMNFLKKALDIKDSDKSE